MRQSASSILEDDDLTDHSAVDVIDSEEPKNAIDDSLLNFGTFEKHIPSLEDAKAAIVDSRNQGFLKQHTRTHVTPGRKKADSRQGNAKNIQIRSFEKQEEILLHIMKRYGLTKKKHAFDAMLAVTLKWAEEGRPINAEMLDPYLNNDYHS